MATPSVAWVVLLIGIVQGVDGANGQWFGVEYKDIGGVRGKGDSGKK